MWAPHLPTEFGGMGLSFMQHAYMNEVLAYSPGAASLFGVVAPNSGNQKILVKYGSPEQHDYSKRLGRFIKQTEFADGCGVIEFQVDQRTYRLPVATAVAEVFLTDDDKQEIIDAVPDLDELQDDEISAHPVVEARADQHNVIPEAIVSVLLRARRAA